MIPSQYQPWVISGEPPTVSSSTASLTARAVNSTLSFQPWLDGTAPRAAPRVEVQVARVPQPRGARAAEGAEGIRNDATGGCAGGDRWMWCQGAVPATSRLRLKGSR